MKKRFITFALALSIIFSFSTVSAKYYVEDNKGGESAEEIFAYSVDTDKMIADLQNALSLVKDGEDAEKHPVRFRQRDGGAFAPEGSH